MSLEKVLAWVAPSSAEADLARQVDLARLPAHVAVIMDGNGRWAAQRHLPRVEGHRAGIDAVRDAVELSARLGIGVLTLYAFSVENSKRLKRCRWRLTDLCKRGPRPSHRAHSGSIRFWQSTKCQQVYFSDESIYQGSDYASNCSTRSVVWPQANLDYFDVFGDRSREG